MLRVFSVLSKISVEDEEHRRKSLFWPPSFQGLPNIVSNRIQCLGVVLGMNIVPIPKAKMTSGEFPLSEVSSIKLNSSEVVALWAI